MSHRRLAFTAVALLASAAPLVAQQRQAAIFSVEGGATYNALRGDVCCAPPSALLSESADERCS